MSLRLTLVAPLVMVLGSLALHQGQVMADEARLAHRDIAQEMLFAPDGEVLRVASLDHHVHVADLLWVRTVLEFGANYDAAPDPAWGQWLIESIEGITELDPRWRTPYFFGGVMLRLVGEIDASTEIFKRGAEALPEDPFFPFSVGMNYYMHHGDPEEAARWVEMAAERPKAPDWYKVAAVSFRQNARQRPQAIRYLQEELASTQDDNMREELERRIAELVHEELVERFAQAAEAHTQRTGAPPERPADLVGSGLLRQLPADPLGGEWVVDIDGQIRSSVDAERRAALDLRIERAMLRSMR
ncbi:MAG: hypothetical protein H6741_09570 [Alphaproteobacteria bacterium]|nr:hypothetical protein [Alphaproteobacteria bacterium]